MKTHPNGAAFGWSLLERKILVKSQWSEIRSDDINFRGKTLTYTYVVSPGAVFVVPVTEEGRYVLIRNYRWTIDDVCWEVPAGLRNHPTAKSLEDLARAEMKEEAGCVGGDLFDLGEFYSANGVCDLKIALYLASGVTLESNQPEDTENILEIRAFTRAEVEEMLDQHQITDGDTVLSLLLAFRFLDRQRKKPEVDYLSSPIR